MNRFTHRLCLLVWALGIALPVYSHSSFLSIISLSELKVVFALLILLFFFLRWPVWRRDSRPQRSFLPTFRIAPTAFDDHRIQNSNFVIWVRQIMARAQDQLSLNGIQLQFHPAREKLFFPFIAVHWQAILNDLIIRAVEAAGPEGQVDLHLDVSPPGESVQVVLRLECNGKNGTTLFSESYPLQQADQDPEDALQSFSSTQQLIREMDGSLVVQMAPGGRQSIVLKTPIPLPSIQGQPS